MQSAQDRELVSTLSMRGKRDSHSGTAFGTARGGSSTGRYFCHHDRSERLRVEAKNGGALLNNRVSPEELVGGWPRGPRRDWRVPPRGQLLTVWVTLFPLLQSLLR